MGFIPKEQEEVIEEEERPEEEPEEDKEKVVETKPKKVVKKEKHRWVVVKELPTQVVRETIAEDKTVLHFITTEEALSQIMNQ